MGTNPPEGNSLIAWGRYTLATVGAGVLVLGVFLRIEEVWFVGATPHELRLLYLLRGASLALATLSVATVSVARLARRLRAANKEMRRGEEALRETNETLRALIQASPLAIMALDREGKILMWNPAAEQTFGWSEAEAVNKFIPLVPADAREEFWRFHNNVMGGGKFTGAEVHAQKKDGSLIDVMISIAPVRDARGRITAGIGVLIDITERKRAEEALRKSEERYRSLVQQSLEGIYLVDPRTRRILEANAAFLSMLDYTEDEITGLTLYDIAAAERASVDANVQVVLQKGRHVIASRQYRRKDGTVIDVEVRTSLISLGASQIVLVNARDITERRKLEEQFRQAQKMEAVGRLAGGIAHDFNNLLTIITGYCQLLLGRLTEADQMHEQVKEIKSAGDRAALLTRQLLAFSRQQVLEPQVLDLNVLVADMEKMLSRLIGEDIGLVTVAKPGLGRVKADPGQIEQVIMNLAVNARDAMPRGGKLTIETANVDLDEAYTRAHAVVTPGPYVMLAVSDTGHGMEAETQARIFEPFFTTKERGKGTGLGLSTVYGIVKQSGGYIWVYSEPGQGTTFKIYLPRVEEALAGAQTREVRPGPPRGTETILLVEDEEAVRRLACGVLEANGYTVLEARQGEDALRISGQHKGPIHLLLTDMVMPKMGGPELAKALTPARPEMKTLSISGYTDDSIVHNGVLDKGVPFLQKPFTPDVLARKVREVLDTSTEK